MTDSPIRAKAREAAKDRWDNGDEWDAIADAVAVAVLREVLNYPHKCYTAAYAAVPVPDLERELDALLREAPATEALAAHCIQCPQCHDVVRDLLK